MFRMKDGGTDQTIWEIVWITSFWWNFFEAFFYCFFLSFSNIFNKSVSMYLIHAEDRSIFGILKHLSFLCDQNARGRGTT